MLDKIKEKFLELLPEKIREKFDSQEDFDEDDEYDETEGTQKTQFRKLDEEERTRVIIQEIEEDEEDFDADGEEPTDSSINLEEDEVSEEDLKKEKSKKRIKMILIGMIALVAIDSVLFTENSNDEKNIEKVAREKLKKKVSKPKEVASEPKSEIIEEGKAIVEGKSERPKIEVTEMIKEVSSSEAEDGTIDTIKTDSTEERAATEIVPMEKETPIEIANADDLSINPPEEDMDMKLGAEIEEKEEDAIGQSNSTMNKDLSSNIGKISNLIEKIDSTDARVEDEIDWEGMDKVNYANLGRGLVYNCKGKHWACVNKNSYFKCRDIKKIEVKNERSPSCTIMNVYRTIEDCQTVQRYNVTKNIKTDKCDL